VAEVSLALALGLVVAAFIPMWGLVVWMAKSSSPPARWLAEGRWLKALAWLVFGLSAAAIAIAGWLAVWGDLLGTDRPAEQRIVFAEGVALFLLWLVAGGLVEKRRRSANASPPATRPDLPKLAPRFIVMTLLAWVAAAGIFAVWTIGPMASGPASPRDRTILTVACFVIATLVVMLVDASRKARLEATKRDGNSTGGGSEGR
jgi:hypothetical protein